MFFLAYIINAYGALASQYGFTTIYRLDLGGLIIGFLDLILGLTVLAIFLSGPTNLHKYPSVRMHLAMRTVIGFQITGTVLGLIAGIVYGNPIKYVFSDLREYISLPIYILAGYTLLSDPRAAGRLVMTITYLGIGTALLLIINFGANAAQSGAESNTNLLRTVNYNETYAGISSVFFAYLLLTRSSKVPALILATLSGICFVGVVSPLTRSAWLATAVCFCVLLLLLPRAQRVATAIRLGLVGAALIIFVALGVAISSSVMQRDFASLIEKRIGTLDPWNESAQEHAWDSRVGAYWPELQMWFANPLSGSGFGAQWAAFERGNINFGFKHNGWSAMLATTGIFGFSGNTMMVICMIVIGYRLARDNVDRGSTLIGVFALLVGCYTFIDVLATMVYTSRNSMLFGVVCGAMFRCRDIEPVTLAQFAGYINAPEDEPAFESLNPLVPDELIDVEPFAR